MTCGRPPLSSPLAGFGRPLARPAARACADVVEHVEAIAGAGRDVQTGDVDGSGGTGLVVLLFQRGACRTWPSRARRREPQTITSPVRSVPLRTSSLATTPRPSCNSASRHVPLAGPSGLALYSCNSATVSRVSSSSSMPSPVAALVLTTSVSPPHSLGNSSLAANCSYTRCGLAPGRSILFRATTIGTSAARAWLIASSVCGMTPSSAATTSTAMSVTLAPRARISVKAS